MLLFRPARRTSFPTLRRFTDGTRHAVPALTALALTATVLAPARDGGALQAQGATAPFARVSGPVIDSLTGAALSGAVVQFANAQDPRRVHTVIADSLGRYRVDSIVPGVYLIGLIHPRADQLGVSDKVTPIRIADGGDIELPLGTPSAEALRERHCRGASGLFLGRVRTSSNGPLRGPARVRVQYVEVTVTATGVSRRSPARFTDAEANGIFAMCGLPTDAVITTRAAAGRDSSGTIELRMPENGIIVRDLFVGPSTRRQASVGGRSMSVASGTARVRGVVRDTLGRPVDNARVVVPGNEVEVGTMLGGVFALDQLPSGTWTIEARAVGFQPTRQVIDLVEGQEITTEFRLADVPKTVDTVKVRADLSQRNLAGFEARMRAGMGGYFFDEKKIASRRVQWIADLLRGTPGVTIQPGSNGGKDQVRLRGLGGSGDCWPSVYLNGVLAVVDRGIIDDIVRPDDIKGIEVYPGTGTMPLEYRGQTGCGSIVIWTGPRGR